MSNSNPANGTKIQLWTCNSSPARALASAEGCPNSAWHYLDTKTFRPDEPVQWDHFFSGRDILKLGRHSLFGGALGAVLFEIVIGDFTDCFQDTWKGPACRRSRQRGHGRPRHMAGDHRRGRPSTERRPDGLGDTEAELNDTPAFAHSAGLDSVSCPRCGTQLDFPGWWMARMDEAFRDGSASALAVRVPCCGTDTTLNDLVYNVPSGFARYQVRVWSPNRRVLDDEELAGIGAALGRPVRQIWSLV
ncbi:hypothetical protein ACI2L1_15090 [Streptomyces sp. NPDC019531]|uniref:hypothetical protein n=1 Tax=Streptomyces sp. NPDC019531 TaxID=3365062 RepID=UPI00384CE758